ncbi:MAG: hypothetical protein RSH25_03120 [Bacteroides sp.]|uniref:DUF6562 domain-containing protein n=1 Tax=Bacteroides sp. TaxID=29523 RepID=UPI002FC60836
MKKKYHCLILSLFLILLYSCKNQRNDKEEEKFPIPLKDITIEVILNFDQTPSTSLAERNDSAYSRRLIIEIQHEGERTIRQTTVVQNNQLPHTILINTQLRALNYTLVVWSDYVKTELPTDLYYNTENLHSIRYTQPYRTSPYREATYGTAAINLADLPEYVWNNKISINVQMLQPLAQYQLITTDVQRFLDAIKEKYIEEGDYETRFSYGFYFPTGFNALTGKTVHSETGVHFTLPLILPTDNSQECMIGSDYILVDNNTESFVVLLIEVITTDGKIISSTDLEIPYKRNQLSIIKKDLITSFYSDGGVGIDPDFDGDTLIEIKSLRKDKAKFSIIKTNNH